MMISCCRCFMFWFSDVRFGFPLLNFVKIAQHDLKVKTSPGPTGGSDWQPAIKNQAKLWP